MAVTATTLRTAHPEFTDSPDAVVNAAITDAQATVNETVLGDNYDQAVTLLACHLISRSPYSRDLRLPFGEYDEDGYYRRYEQLIRVAGRAYRVYP